MPWGSWFSQPPAQQAAAPASTTQPAAAGGAVSSSGQPKQVPVVQATVVPQAARPAPPPDERVPAIPESVPELEKLGAAELEILQANTLAMDDLIIKTRQGRACTNRVAELRQETHDLATKILNLEEKRDSAAARASQEQSGTAQLREDVEALSRVRDEILARRSPDVLANALKARAQDFDANADNLLEKVLDDGANTMDAAALQKFRQSFVEQKVEKHWRCALTEAVLKKNPAAYPPVVGV